MTIDAPPTPRMDECVDADELRASWIKLVRLFAARRATEVHECPVCRRAVTHAATLCSSCWTKRGPGLVARAAMAAP